MKRLLLPILAIMFTIHSHAQSPIDIEQLYGAPGGAYIIFTDDGTDYPLTGIQEYHKWKDLHLIDTLMTVGDSICVSLFMDSIPMLCTAVPCCEAAMCIDTFYQNEAMDTLFLVSCDGDTTTFATGGGGDADWFETLTTDPPDDDGDSQYHSGKVSIGADGPYDGTLNITNDNSTAAIEILQNADAMILRSRTLISPEYSWSMWQGDDGSFYIVNQNSASGAVVKRPFLIERSTSSTPDNQLQLQADGDIQIPDYPDSRDDGTPVNVLGTDGSGVVQSYPVGDLPDPSSTNEVWTISDGTNTEAISTQTVPFVGGTGISTTYNPGTNTLTITNTISDTDTDDQGLTIEGSGPTYDIAIDNGSDVTVQGVGITLSESPANTLVLTAVDASATNEIQTLDVSGTTQPITLDLSSDASDPTITGAGAVTVSASGNAITITGTGPTADQTLDATGSSTVTWDLSGDATDISLTGAGIAAVSRVGNAVTVTATEIDGSTTNELQTIANTSNATSHTATLSNSGGSVQLIEGTNISLTTGGTGLNGTVTIAATATDDQALTFDGGSGPVGLVIDNVPGSIDFIEGTGISLTSTATTMTITATGGTSDADWLEEGLGTPPNSINDNMYTGTGEHGIGTTTPDRLVDIAASAATGPIMQMDYTTGTDVNGIMGKQEFAYGNSVKSQVIVQKQTNNSNNDAHYGIQMKDDGGSLIDGLEIDYEAGNAVDKPRLKTFGGHQNQNWVNVAVTTSLDEGHYGVRATASSITLTLPLLTITNTEGIGTELIIYNQSAGSITIDPGTGSDTLNGSTSNMTLLTKESKMFICTFIDGSNNADWISID